MMFDQERAVGRMWEEGTVGAVRRFDESSEDVRMTSSGCYAWKRWKPALRMKAASRQRYYRSILHLEDALEGRVQGSTE